MFDNDKRINYNKSCNRRSHQYIRDNDSDKTKRMKSYVQSTHIQKVGNVWKYLRSLIYDSLKTVTDVINKDTQPTNMR
jgi:hypothetical protein